MKKNMQKIAVFDIDGTIFRSSLLIEVTEELIQAGLFSTDVMEVYEKPYKQWLERSGSYDMYIKAVIKAFEKNIKGVDRDDFLKAVKQVIKFQYKQVYRYTRDLFIKLKKKNYFIIAISGSPRDIVLPFCKKMGFNKIYARVYEVGDNNKFTGNILFTKLINDKEKILKLAIEKNALTLSGSIGVGDTEADISFLKMVEKPICFNPNKKLYNRAKRLGWEIVVERKNVVYKF